MRTGKLHGDGFFNILYRVGCRGSKFDRASRTASLTLEQSRPILLNEVSIWGATLVAFDVAVDVV